ncbi:hypothetical protein [Leifsonia shinshuensis]|uniref:Uncharacterized protein n=1 Tax=Leifsonia shinshuensis TaxID=150026 RepID=A0A7G6YDZ0_9MICO|nr:hypothetical protein [Leifsonia shinshuensis]QNE36705.1 hypothetical protein F1C12_17355 [Leifsonia shinshuensis]
MRRLSIAAAGVALALGLAGCAGGGTYAADTASSLQHGVLGVATAANGKDYAGALSQLASLQQRNDAALKAGTIAAGRHDAIAKSLAAVKADLTQLKDAAERAQLQQQLQQLQQQQKDQKGKGKGHGDGGDGGDGG